MLSKELLENAGKILNEDQFSDDMYQRIHTLFSDSSLSDAQKNNARAKVKKELAAALSFTQVLSVISIIISVGIGASDGISPFFIGVVALAYGAVYWFKLYPVITKDTYVLSILEDGANKKIISVKKKTY